MTGPTPTSELANLADHVERFADARILCVGDSMLDRFVYGEVSRISPEAPIPVLTRKDEKRMLGGAGNVVRNIISLGAKSCFISVIGDDAVGHDLVKLIGGEKNIEPYLITESGRVTTEKTRYIASNQQLLRCDDETKQQITADSTKQLITIAAAEITKHDMLILSDYGKGVLHDACVRALIDTANAANKPVLIDPKRHDYSIYSGAYLVSPNLNELALAANVEEFENQDEIINAARELLKAHQIQYILVTQGKDGMTLISSDEAQHIPTRARDIFDVSGAGDTAIATLAVAASSGCNLLHAAQIANIAAGIVVGKLGTATIHRTDIKTALYTHDTVNSQAKILPQNVAQEVVQSWQYDGKKIGFTNGCFDILHAGHLSLLQDAKARCDKLIVGLNSDASVKRLKGESRPMNSELDRAMLLAGMDAVDLVVVFREDTPLELLETLKPNLLMKGADYSKDQVVGAELVESYGGEIVLLDLKEGYSSTNLIKKAQKAV